MYSRNLASNVIDAVINNLENNEVMFFLHPAQLAFMKQDGIDYGPTLKTLIRIMDDPKDDVYHHYLEYKMPPIISTRIIGK